MPRVLLLLLACVAASPSPAAAWGFLGHRIVNAQAIQTLPAPLRDLFAANAQYVAEHSIDPDLWRGAGLEGEAPNHFLDMDAFSAAPPFPEIPRVEAEHLARHGAEAVDKGRLPWRVAEAYRDLVAAFRSGDPARVLQQAAVLGHYVADAHVPLHAVLNYNGQLTGQTGLHNRWESQLVERFERQLLARLKPAAVPPPGEPVAATFATLGASFVQAAEVLAADRETAGPRDLATTTEDDRYDEAYYSRFFEREGERVLARLTRAAETLGAFWRQAWEEAGRPELPASFRFPYVRGTTRAILVSVDGAPAGFIDEAIGRGLMPRLARLREAGASARGGALTSLPAKTASGHATLYTGAWSDRHGIVGNEVPVPEGTVLEQNTGYDTTHLAAEPIWVTVARQGLDATVATGAQVYPFAPFLDERRFGGNYGWNMVLFDGYQPVEAADQTYRLEDLRPRPPGLWLGPLPAHAGEAREVEVQVEDVRLDGLLYDDPADPVAGFDTLYLGLDRDPRGGITLKPVPPSSRQPAFQPLQLRIAGDDKGIFFRLFALSPDGSDLLLYRTAAQTLRAWPSRLEAVALQATGGFIGNGASRAYAAGKLGPPLSAGGDGTAERRYLETVGLVSRQFSRLTALTAERTEWDLLVTYLPYPDEALHLWLGVLDPSLAGHDPALAARVRPFVDEVLGIVDGFLGELWDRTKGEAVLAVATDHGMAGLNRIFRPNVALAAAGLLALDGNGRIDLSRTRAVYFPGNSGMVLINRAGRPGGIVPPEQEEQVRRAAAAALRAARDPLHGRPVVLDLLDARRPHEPAMGTGDLYLSIAPGYELSGSTAGPVADAMKPQGNHRVNPERPEMHGLFVMAGPGVAAGVDLGRIRQIDIAPTVCALLGIDPPAQAAGRVLEKALAFPPVPVPARP